MTPAPALISLGGDGPPALLIHGYGSDRQSWAATSPGLLEQAQVWVLDLPAHGSSGSDIGEGTIAAIAETILYAIDEANIDRLHLIGHSLGGIIAIEMALQRPERTCSLAMLSPAGVTPCINQDFLSRFYSAEDIESVNTLLQMLVHNPKLIAPTLAEGVLDYLNKPGVRESLARISQALLEAGEQHRELLLALKNLAVPTMSLWGENDRINQADTSSINQLDGPVHTFANCGHLPHIEKRTQVNGLLSAFIQQHKNR